MRYRGDIRKKRPTNTLSVSLFFFVTSDAISTCNFYRQTQRTTEIQLFLPTHNVGNAFVTDVLWHTQHQKHLIKRVLNWSGGWPVQGLGSGEHRLRLISGSSVGFRTPDGVRCATLPEQGTERLLNVLPEREHEIKQKGMTAEQELSFLSLKGPGSRVGRRHGCPPCGLCGGPREARLPGKAACISLCRCLWARVFPDLLPLKKIYLLWIH